MTAKTATGAVPAAAPFLSRVRSTGRPPLNPAAVSARGEIERLRNENRALRFLVRFLRQEFPWPDEDRWEALAAHWEAQYTEVEQKLADQNGRIAELWATMARLVP